MRAWVLLCFLGACGVALPAAPVPSADEGGRRQQELDWLVKALERRHPDIYSVTSRWEFAREVDQLRARLPKQDAQQAFLGLMHVVAMVGDSHTRLSDWSPIQELQLPVTFGAWPEGYWSTAVQPDRSDLFARRLIEVEGRPVEEVAEALAPYVPHDNEITLRMGVAKLLGLPQALHAAGLSRQSERVAMTLRGLDGTDQEFEIEARPKADMGPWAAFAPAGWSEPLYRSRMNEWWWWIELPEERTLYFQYNRCADREEAPFVVVAAAILERLERGDLERLVIDLRHNGGGNSAVLEPLVRGLARRPQWRGGDRISVLIGNGTYSSGMLNAWQLSDQLGARLVGEPTAQKPNSFGELRAFELPFSGLRVDCSTRRFRPLSGDPPSLEPDVLVPSSFEDLHHGRDLVLDWVLAQN